VIFKRLCFAHVIDQGGQLFELGKLSGLAAAVAAHKLVFSVLPLAQDDRLLYAVKQDACDKSAVGLVGL